MLFGQTIIVQRKFDAEDWLRLVDKYRVSSTFSAPALVRMICALPKEVKDRYDRSTMRVMIANAAPWSYALKQQYVADFPAESLFEVYGSTELGVDTVLLPEDQLRKPGSCGQPAPGIEIVLFDDDGNEVTGTGPDHPGEVFIRSKGAFDTYYKNDASYEANSRGDYHTVGDIAYWDDEGYLYICDRKTDMIISGGMNIYPAEIEAALEQHPDIYDVAVFGIPSEEWGEAVHATVVRAPGSSLTGEEVTAFAPGAPGQLQGAAVGGLHGRAAAHRLGQDPQAPAARALLGRPHRPGRLGPGRLRLPRNSGERVDLGRQAVRAGFRAPLGNGDHARFHQFQSGEEALDLLGRAQVIRGPGGRGVPGDGPGSRRVLGRRAPPRGPTGRSSRR